MCRMCEPTGTSVDSLNRQDTVKAGNVERQDTIKAGNMFRQDTNGAGKPSCP